MICEGMVFEPNKFIKNKILSCKVNSYKKEKNVNVR